MVFRDTTSQSDLNDRGRQRRVAALEMREGAPPALLPRYSPHSQTEFNIPKGGQPRIQGVVALKDDCPVSTRPGDRATGDLDHAARSLLEARYQVQYCGFAAATGTEQAEELARIHAEIEIANGVIATAPSRLIALADCSQANQRHRRISPGKAALAGSRNGGWIGDAAARQGRRAQVACAAFQFSLVRVQYSGYSILLNAYCRGQIEASLDRDRHGRDLHGSRSR
jgi:hypothetical protein